MAATISDAVFDAALQYIEDNGDEVHILSSATMTWSEIASKTLGNKASPSYTGPENGTSGRKLTLGAISDGTVTGTGTATHFAITNGSNAVLVCQELNASQGVTSGNTFTLTAAIIQLADPTA